MIKNLLGGVLRRYGDVLVTLLAFLTLGALAAPAVARLIDRAQSQRCVNNLKLIGQAVHDSYYAGNKCFPPGWLGPNPDDPDASASPQVGLLVPLLPHLGHDDLFKQLHYQKDLRARTAPPTDPVTGRPYDPPSDVPWWQLTAPDGVSNLERARLRLPALICPSDDPYSSQEATIVGVHVWAAGTPGDFIHPALLAYGDHPLARDLGRTNYLGVAGCVGTPVAGAPKSPNEPWYLYAGVFGNRSAIGFQHIRDGSSTTLLIGECSGGNAGPGRDGRAFAFSWLAGPLPTYHGLYRGPSAPWYAFGSRHRQIHFAFADGSVLGLWPGATTAVGGTDWFLLQHLAGVNDGNLLEIVDDD